MKIFTGAVAVGLVMEYLPGVIRAARTNTFPEPLVGALLITIGVAGELVILIWSSRYETKLRELNDSIIAETVERAAQAEKAAAEANLARSNLELTLWRRTARRLLNLEEEKELADALSEFAGQTFNVRFSGELKPPNPFRVGDWTFEQSNFVGQLTRILSAAGWIEVHIMLADNPVVSSGVTLFISEQSAHKAGFALYGSLAKLLISSQPCFVRADEIRSQILHGPQYPALNVENPGAVLPMIIVVGPL